MPPLIDSEFVVLIVVLITGAVVITVKTLELLLLLLRESTRLLLLLAAPFVLPPTGPLLLSFLCSSVRAISKPLAKDSRASRDS